VGWFWTGCSVAVIAATGQRSARNDSSWILINLDLCERQSDREKPERNENKSCKSSTCLKRVCNYVFIRLSMSNKKKNDQLGSFCISLYENRKIEPTQPHTTYTQASEAPLEGGDGTLIHTKLVHRPKLQRLSLRPHKLINQSGYDIGVYHTTTLTQINAFLVFFFLRTTISA
jgi:hypothetical protein